MNENGRKYLVWFGHNNSYFNCRFLELESLAEQNGVRVESLYDSTRPSPLSTDPFAIVSLPSDEIAKRIGEKSVLIRYIVDLWGTGGSDDDVIDSVRKSVSREVWDSHFVGKPFSYKVIGYGTQYSDKQRKDRMCAFATLFYGPEKVDLKSPITNLIIIDQFEALNLFPTGTRDDKNNPLVPKFNRTFYGRIVWSYSTSPPRSKYVLTERPILGPTSLDNDLAFMMANIAQVEGGKLVYDSFCGTGGLMIAASALGGTCFGSDIDVRVLRGEFVSYVHKQVSENQSRDIYENFKYYKLPAPEVIAMDNSHTSFKLSEDRLPMFDIILTDPPYGVRAGAKKIGQKSPHDVVDRDSYYPQMLGYSPDEVNTDLLSLSSKLLVSNGLLVFLLHIDLIDLFSQEELEELRALSHTRSAGATRVLVHKFSGTEYVYANEGARDRQFLDEVNIRDRVVPIHPDFEFAGCALQILAAGTGRVIVKLRRC